MKVVISGDFYDHNVTGVQRYAREVISYLDDMYSDKGKVQLELLIPKDMKNVPKLKNIPIIRYKLNKKLIWQQLYLMEYCRKNNAYCLCLCTVTPYFYSKKSVNVIHDAANLAHPEFYSKKFIFMNKVLLWHNVKKLAKIITVSNFSKNEIVKYCKINPKKIVVANNSYQHIFEIKSDKSVFEDYKGIQPGNYCYALSSLSPNKNFKWIIEVAKKNAECKFLITGMKLGVFSDEELGNIPNNVIFTGYLSDEKVKALMENCRAFVFPTLYEGFGLTPLEALACGAHIIVSDTPCMHEVYGDSAEYINPNKYDYSIMQLIKKAKLKDISKTLEKYSWARTAKLIYKTLESLS